MVSLGFVGAGQFAPWFAKLFVAHPGIDRVIATDVVPGRAEEMVSQERLHGTVADFDELLATDVEAVAIFTQRWTHGPMVVKALRAGKHVYSAVPMGVTLYELVEIVRAVEETGLVYMMGETSHYNPAAVLARQKMAEGAFGRVFYSEGDYVHDMDKGFYDAYRYSGGDQWKQTASYPPMLYPTHAIGGVLGGIGGFAISVSCIGVRDDRNDGVFDRDISQFGNDFSNASALFELDGGGVMRTNEMRRVGYPSQLRESRFRYFGTKASFEQLATISLWQDAEGVEDITELLATADLHDGTGHVDQELVASLSRVSPDLRDAFVTGHARIHDLSRLPEEFRGLHSGHEGSHHFLVDDFVTAVLNRSLPPVNAWQAARYTLPGIVAHESALQHGERLPIDDLGDAPVEVGTVFSGLRTV